MGYSYKRWKKVLQLEGSTKTLKGITKNLVENQTKYGLTKEANFTIIILKMVKR